MKAITLLAALLCLFTACKKTPTQTYTPPTPAPEMDVINFNDRAIRFNESMSADLNHDGTNDFSVHTLLIGDPLLQRDYKRFLFGTAPSTDLPINHSEEVPMLYKNNVIGANAFPGCTWYDITAITAAQKVITTTQTFWEGVWKNARHQYLPLRIHKDEQTYYGWVEISFDSNNEKLILHQAAISKQAGVVVLAGN